MLGRNVRGAIVADEGDQVRVPDLVRSVHSDPAARSAFGHPPLAERLLVPAGGSPPHASYLRWHHENIYRSLLPAAPQAPQLRRAAVGGMRIS
jgi:putative restriction endonuclease